MRRRAFLTAFAASALALIPRPGPVGRSLARAQAAARQAPGDVLLAQRHRAQPVLADGRGRGLQLCARLGAGAAGGVQRAPVDLERPRLQEREQPRGRHGGDADRRRRRHADPGSVGRSIHRRVACPPIHRSRRSSSASRPMRGAAASRRACSTRRGTRSWSPDQDPVSVYKRLFGDANASSAEIDAGLRKKLSVLE